MALGGHPRGMIVMVVSLIEKFAGRCRSRSSGNQLSCLLLVFLSTSMLLVAALEMERTKGGCLQVTLQAGEHIKADPRCIVSRGAGLALRPPATAAAVHATGLLDGLRRRIHKAHGQQQQQQQQQQEKLRDNSLQRLSNTMASNATDCFLAPSFPGDIALVSVRSGCATSESEERGGGSLSSTPLRSPSRPRSRPRPSSAGQPSGRTHIDTDVDVDIDPELRRSRRPSTTSKHGKTRKTRSKAAGRRGHDPDKPRKLVLLTRAIVAVGPGVTVSPMPSEDKARGGGGGGSSPRPHQEQRGGATAATGSLSVCEGLGSVAVAGCGRLQALRLGPGQKVEVDSSRAVGWTSSVMCLGGAGGRASRSTTTTTTTTKGATSPSAVATFVGPGTVYIQTHSLSGLRRLLLPKPVGGGSLRGHGRGVTSSLLGGGSRGRRGATPSPRRGGVVGLSLKRGLAKRTKAGAKRALLGLSFLALYAVVTALLLEGRDGLSKAPRHAVQVARSLAKVARRVAMILIRLAREELWRAGEEGGGGDGGSLPGGNPVER